MLYRQGKIPGSFYTGRGNEAAAVGVGFAMGVDDIGAPTQRDMGVHVARGTEPWRIFAQYMGRVDGPTAGRDGNVHMAELAARADRDGLAPAGDGARGVRLRAGVPHRGEPRVALGWSGDGATSRSDWHEALNFAGVRRLPVVFVVDNNQFAYSTPNYLEFATRHIADRAAGLRLRGRRGGRHRRARRAPRGAGGDREGTRRRRPDAARAGDAARRGTRRARRRVLRAARPARRMGALRSPRALPCMAEGEPRRLRRRRGRPRSARRSRRCWSTPSAARRQSPLPDPATLATASRPCRKSSTPRITGNGWRSRPICRRSGRPPRGDAPRRARVRDRRGRRRLRRRLQGHPGLPGRVRAVARPRHADRRDRHRRRLHRRLADGHAARRRDAVRRLHLLRAGPHRRRSPRSSTTAPAPRCRSSCAARPAAASPAARSTRRTPSRRSRTCRA